MSKLPVSGPDLTIGLEEEVFLVERETLDLAPRAPEVLERLDPDPCFKLELPAAQVEILTPPCKRVADASLVLAAGRRKLLDRAGEAVGAIGCGVHPFAAIEGQLNRGGRYARIETDHRSVARRQLVCALHIHVSVAGAGRSLAVYNALRSHLPEIAALAANAPFQFGHDTGLASARPTVGSMLPRQGIPPTISSWEAFTDELAWGERAGAVPDPKSWWWDLRPNLVHGTIEVRIADTQIATADTAAVAAFVHCLAASLADRHDANELLPTHETWRIAENRWSAARDGTRGSMADLLSGQLEPTAERLERLIDELHPVGERLGCSAELAQARGLCNEGGAVRQRQVAESQGIRSLVRWLMEQFN